MAETPKPAQAVKPPPPKAPNAPKGPQSPLDELAQMGQPWWYRYSKHGEFPWSTVTSVLLHLLLILLVLVLARATVSKERTPVEIAGVTEVADDSSVAADPGDAAPGEESALEEKTDVQPKETPPEPMTPDVTPIKVPTPTETPLAPPTVDNGSMVLDESAKAEQVAERLRNAERLRENLKKHSASRPKGAGGSGSGGGGGGGRAERPARWILKFNTRSPQEYLEQLDGLEAVVAFPVRGDKYRYFHNASSGNRKSEVRDLNNEGRLFWIDNKIDSVAAVCSFLGISTTSMMVVFLPQELEERMLQMELAFQNKQEDEIRSTTFQAQQRGGKMDVVVERQVLK
jgi:hypothetical protein